MATKRRKLDEVNWVEAAGLAGAIEGSQYLLFVTGAGVSVASGLPTFRGRDPGAVWSRDVLEYGTYRFFRQAPARSWEWYRARFGGLVGAEPNDAHRALVALERWQRARGRGFCLVTQNVDGLHSAAGSEDVIDVHGRADRLRCSAAGCELGAPRGSLSLGSVDFGPFDAEPNDARVPRCPRCEALLRPHVLWFDERYDGHADYRIGEVYRAAKRADVVVFVGTSFSVGVTEGVLGHALSRGAFVCSVDPAGAAPRASVSWCRGAAEEVLPEVACELDA